MDSSPVAVVIPCYNEEHRFLKSLFIAFYEANPLFSFCFVNDGSTDHTADVILDIQKNRTDRIHLINRKTNKGKAESVREGVLYLAAQKNYTWIGYIDADFATPLGELVSMLQATRGKPTVFIMGSRFRRLGSNIQRSPFRFYIGRLFATIISTMLKMNVYDTQCGAKLIKADVAANIFKEGFVSAWLFDVELLFRTIAIYGRKEAQSIVVEYPLAQWSEIKGSKLKPKDFIGLPVQLIKIHTVYRKKLY